MSYVKYLRDVLGEGFKEFVTKFSSEDENINDYVDKFKLLKTRNKIKGVEADIDQWIKKDFVTFKKFVDSFDESKIKSRNEVKKEAYKNVVAENNEYVIIKINNADDAYALGKGTKWCIASGEKKDAMNFYDEYNSMSTIYFAIKKNLGEVIENVYPKFDKIAILDYGKNKVYYDTEDIKYSDIPTNVNIPKILIKSKIKIPVGWYINSDGTFDVEGSIEIEYEKIYNGKMIYSFGKVDGNFTCESEYLTTLDGCPHYVGGDFNCMYTSITTLKGSPNYVGGDFECSATKIKSLEYAPKKVIGDFICNGTYVTTGTISKNLKYLKGVFGKIKIS